MKGPVISLGRQYGAGGREIGEILSELMGIHYYDKELMRVASDHTGIEESRFHLADEKPGEKVLYRIMRGLRPNADKPASGSLLSDENLFRFQKEVILQLAEKEEACVIVGRCADFILRDNPRLVSVFIHSDEDHRVERIARRTSYDPVQAAKNLKKIDKERSDYYNYYTGREWGDFSNYDLCIDSGKLGARASALLIIEYLKLRGFEV